MMNNKKQGFSLKFAALILVLAVAASGLTIFLSHRGKEPAQEAAVQAPLVENLAETTQSTTSAPIPSASTPSVSAPAAPLPRATEPAVSATVPAAVTNDEVLKTAMPVPGEAISAYAMDCLSYNETTRDWRTHNGIDLAAEAGAPVGAAADGTVYTTYEDDALGYTVVIRHTGGYTTRYSSLREDLCVQPGDTVTLGQTIGYAGDTALVETVMGSHVHFSVSCQDQPMDPAEFLNLS